MNRQLITTTQRGLMRPLAYQGIFAVDCHSQIQQLLTKHCGPAHAALFAEPVSSPQQDTIDWYTTGATAPVKITDLPPEQAQTVRQKIAALGGEIRAYADAHQQQDGQKGSAAHLLSLALQHPADEDIWLAGDQPVVVNWGFAPGTVGAQPEDLSRPAPAPVIPAAAIAPVAPVAAVPPPGGCLRWLLPLLLLLLLLWLLLAAGGILPLPAGCTRLFEPPLTDSAPLDQARQKEQDLLAERDALLAQLRQKAALCVPEKQPEPVIPAEPEPVQEEPQPGQVEPQLVKEEPQQVEPSLVPPEPEPKPEVKPKPAPKPEVKPEPKEEPKVQPKPEPKPEPKPKPKKNEALTVPEDAKKTKDLSFLEGCWQSETGLYNNSGIPLIAEYCFDKNGKGTRFVREKNGRACSGAAKARFSGNSLQLDAQNAECRGGGTYVPQRIDCTGSGANTHCKGQELGGRRNKWDADFRRK